MTRITLFVIALLLTSGLAQAGDTWDWDDIFAPYRQRSDRMTSSSGNAQNVNTATQVITFWPPQVRDRRIPANGSRMTGAIQRYHGGNQKRLPTMRQQNETIEMTIETSETSPSSSKTGASTSGQK